MVLYVWWVKIQKRESVVIQLSLFMWKMQYLCFCFRFCRNYRYVALVFATYLELYCSVYQGVEGVVAAHADVAARVELCTSLTNDDVACLASLTAEYLHA